MNHWPRPRILVQRGGGTPAPEKTLCATGLGASLGFRGVQFDVTLAGALLRIVACAPSLLAVNRIAGTRVGGLFG